MDLSGLSEAASRIENAILWNDTNPQIKEYEDDDDGYYEGDAGWYTVDCDDELDEIAYTAGMVLQSMTQNFLKSWMVTWKTLTRPHLKCTASCSFQEAHELLARVKSARGYFPVNGIGAFDGLAQPSTDRKPATPRGKGKKGTRKGKSSSQKGGKPTNLGKSGILPKPQTSRYESRPPMSKKSQTEVGATRGGPHFPPRLRPDQCMFSVDKWDIVLPNVPTKEKTTVFSLGQRAFGTYPLGCAVFDSPCYGATVEETEKDQDEENIEDFVAFSIEILEGFAILDGGTTKTVAGFMSVQPVADQYEGTTIETIDVGSTFAGGATGASST